MGGPTLEIVRMALYVFMPVATFYYFNLPSFYANNVKPAMVRFASLTPAWLSCHRVLLFDERFPYVAYCLFANVRSRVC